MKKERIIWIITIVLLIVLFILGIFGYNFYMNHRYSLEEEKGLELYKFMTGDGGGPFTWENGTIANYDEVMSRMTTSYKNSFNYDGHYFSIPYYDEEFGAWGSSGGYGTTYESIFKSIKVKVVTSCLITYEVTYNYRNLGDKNGPWKKGNDIFIVKKNECISSDADRDFSNGYKVEYFDLIVGLKF